MHTAVFHIPLHRRGGRRRRHRHRRGCRSVGVSGYVRVGDSPVVVPRTLVGVAAHTDSGPGLVHMTEVASQADLLDSVQSLGREERRGI